MGSQTGKHLFQKGKSGNPGGRPKSVFIDWCKEFAEKEGKDILMKWARGKNAKASMQAITLISAYGLGKPTEHVEHSGSITYEKFLSEAEE